MLSRYRLSVALAGLTVLTVANRSDNWLGELARRAFRGCDWSFVKLHWGMLVLIHLDPALRSGGDSYILLLSLQLWRWAETSLGAVKASLLVELLTQEPSLLEYKTYSLTSELFGKLGLSAGSCLLQISVSDVLPRQTFRRNDRPALSRHWHEGQIRIASRGDNKRLEFQPIR